MTHPKPPPSPSDAAIEAELAPGGADELAQAGPMQPVVAAALAVPTQAAQLRARALYAQVLLARAQAGRAQLPAPGPAPSETLPPAGPSHQAGPNPGALAWATPLPRRYPKAEAFFAELAAAGQLAVAQPPPHSLRAGQEAPTPPCEARMANLRRPPTVRASVPAPRPSAPLAQDKLEGAADAALLLQNPGGGASMELSIRADLFADLRCSIGVDEAGVTATFWAEDANTRRLLEAEAANLRLRLEGRGLKVAAVRVALAEEAGAEAEGPAWLPMLLGR